MRKNKTNKKS